MHCVIGEGVVVDNTFKHVFCRPSFPAKICFLLLLSANTNGNLLSVLSSVAFLAAPSRNRRVSEHLLPVHYAVGATAANTILKRQPFVDRGHI